MKERQIIEKISKSIHDKDLTAEAFLFGSRARGDNRKDYWKSTLKYSPLYKNITMEGIKL